MGHSPKVARRVDPRRTVRDLYEPPGAEELVEDGRSLHPRAKQTTDETLEPESIGDGF